MSNANAESIADVPIIEIAPEDSDRLFDAVNLWPSGARIQLLEGEYRFSKTIHIPSNTSILGRGADLTRIVLEPESHCHLFTNKDHGRGNDNIALSGFTVHGNGDHQTRQPHHKALTFCCAMYFKKCSSVRVSDVNFFDIRQTATHFNASHSIVVERCSMTRLGWSGVSTSDASNMKISVTVSDAGRDSMHSGIHLDGGVGVYCHADVSDTTGNGIMLDSAYGVLRHVVVKAHVTKSKRGVSLSGSATNEMSNVLISGRFCENHETGIMVSNARSVMIDRSEVCRNGAIGVLLQGRNGGCEVTISDCSIDENPENIRETHASKMNWVFSDDFPLARPLAINTKCMSSYRDTPKS